MRLCATSWLRATAVLFALAMIAAACGNDDDSGDTAEPAPPPPTATSVEAPEAIPEPPPPTEAPQPTPEPPPPTEAPEPSVSLEGFVVDAGTTGGDLLDGVSEAEASCVRDEVGDAAYQEIEDTALVDGGADPSVAVPMAACLSEGNFVAYSTAIVAANAGAHSDESRNCLTDLGLASPEFAYITFGVEGESATSFDPEQLRPFIDDFFGCFTTSERVQLTVRTLDHISSTAPITGQDVLNAMGEDVVKCYLDALGMPLEQFEMAVETAFAAGASSAPQGPDCLNIETIAEILVTLVSRMVGELSDESAGCIRAFGIDFPEYLNLMAFGNLDPESMTEEQFDDILMPGLGVYDCFTTNELLSVQAVIIDMVT